MALRGRARPLLAAGGRLTAEQATNLSGGAADARGFADRMIEVASDKKASDIVVLNVSELTTMADYFLICSGNSERQVQAVAEALIEAAEAAGRPAFGIEGLRAARWILVDFGDVIAHVFTPEERAYYRLERLWGDAPVVVRLQ